MEGQELWLFGAGALVVAAVVFAARWYEGKRTAALQDVAMRLGLSFLAKDESMGMQPFAGFPLFQKGRSRRFRNVARSDDLFVFGYSYTTGTDKNRSTYQQTVAAVRIPSARLPAFELAPEGVFDKIGTAFGGQDIDFEADSEFSRRYRLRGEDTRASGRSAALRGEDTRASGRSAALRGEDETAVRSLFTPALRQHLAMDRGWSLEGAGEWLVVYRKRKRVAPDELATFVQHARRISELIARS